MNNELGSPGPPPVPSPAWPQRLLQAGRDACASVGNAFRVPFRPRPPPGSHPRPLPLPLVHRLPLRALLIVPVLLAVATAAVLFAYADVNVAMVYSQCHARARLPALTQARLVPGVVGTPACFVVSFVEEAAGGRAGAGAGAGAGSMRALATFGAILAFLGGLLTVSTVESARLCNGPSVLIAYPSGPWLAFDLVGGAVVWELVLVPAFLRRAKASREDDEAGSGSNNNNNNNRHLNIAEVVAIPAAIAVGYVAPSLALLATGAPVAIGVWLLFPVYVGAVRRAVRAAVLRWGPGHLASPLHLESHRPSLVAVYALPVLCSAAAHVFLLWHLAARADDRRELTRSTLRVAVIDMFFVGLTVFYWLLVEAGAGVVARTVAWSAVLGPGAGLCLGWVHRERELGLAGGGEDEETGRADEETPLLR